MVSALDGLLSVKFCSFLSPFWRGATNPRRALGQFWLPSTSQWLSTHLAPHPFSQTYFGWPPHYFARWIRSFRSDRRSCVVFQNHKRRSFRVAEILLKDWFLALYFFLCFINDLSASLPSPVSRFVYPDDLTIKSP